MSRIGIDRENFVKGQLEAVSKALTKYEIPLKPKHARKLIVGTHQERSANVFWNAVNGVQLEKNPVLTWKFCHLLHKLLRDGYRKVPEESHRFIGRIRELGKFWKHLNTSGYGTCNETYTKLLADRLEFHRKFPVMPGNLNLNEAQVKTLESDLDNAFEMTISMLDEMDNLLLLQQKTFDTIECLRLNSLIQQGQCLLAPLIMVILDTSKFYDHLVKMIFKLHSQVPPDALEGHRTRFSNIFKKTKEFYERCSVLQYFKYLVSIPTLPAAPPNFLQAGDLESYRPPQAYLRDEGNEDGNSVAEDNLLNLVDVEDENPQQHSPPQVDQRDETIIILQRNLEDERFAKERLIQEARSRIEQYENRLAQMQGEYEHARREADEYKEEKDRLFQQLASRDALRSESDDVRVKEANEKARLSEEKFTKVKAVYEKFRTEHVAALTKLGELQKQLEASDKLNMDKDEEIRMLKRKLEEAEKEKAHLLAKTEADAATIDELRTQLAKADVEMEELRKQIEHLNELVLASLPVNTDIDKDAVGNELELEMRRMDEVIRQAVEQIEAIQRKARENSDGLRLEVNEAILATCQSLMNAIMRLVASSRELQTEIVAAGRGGVSPADFYKKNHQWTEGLLSAAKAVGVAAHVLVAAADGVVTGQGKFEQLIVAAQEIAASTAQLFVSSRVKADKDSEKFSLLSVASRDVNQCTAQVVASVKSGQTTLNEKDVLNFSHLTLHEAKKEEMESQVRMLELEQALNVERARLRELRKQHYHMAQLVTNKNEDKDSSFEFLG